MTSGLSLPGLKKWNLLVKLSVFYRWTSLSLLFPDLPYWTMDPSFSQGSWWAMPDSNPRQLSQGSWSLTNWPLHRRNSYTTSLFTVHTVHTANRFFLFLSPLPPVCVCVCADLLGYSWWPDVSPVTLTLTVSNLYIWTDAGPPPSVNRQQIVIEYFDMTYEYKLTHLQTCYLE